VREWRHRGEDGRTGSVALAAAERGDRITVALCYLAAPLLADGRLAVVLERFTPPAEPVQLVCPHGFHRQAERAGLAPETRREARRGQRIPQDHGAEPR
jgi:DNA-binding transcriptional LysR family regulator